MANSQKATPLAFNDNKTPLLDSLYHPHPLKYNPQQRMYTYGSFIPLDEHGHANIVGSRVFNPNNDLRIAKKFVGLSNILNKEF
jgi:hypothetical protein